MEKGTGRYDDINNIYGKDIKYDLSKLYEFDSLMNIDDLENNIISRLKTKKIHIPRKESKYKEICIIL